MTKDKQIIEEAKYYIKNDVTTEEVAMHFGISKRTFQLHMQKLLDIAPEIAKLQQEKSRQMQMLRRGKYERTAQNTRSASWTKEEAIRIATYMLETNATIRMASEYFQKPKSTVHEIITKGIPKDSPLQKELKELIERHNKDKIQSTYAMSTIGLKK